MLISVCVCTYRRPRVVNTLQSIVAQRLKPGQEIEIVVVDNDPHKSAEPAVAAFAANAPVPVRYSSEPARNIARARNLALFLARGDWLAMIDDDETAAPDWLQELLNAAAIYHADIVIGRVIARYPPDAPRWLVLADPLSRNWGVSGTLCVTGSSANALLNWRLLRDTSVRFDPAFGLSGGEDTDFFGRQHNAGAKIVAAADAVVAEDIPAARLMPAYLKQRAIRAGQSYGLTALRRLPRHRQFAFFWASILKFLLFGAGAFGLSVAARSTALKLRIRGWLNVGKLRACLRRPMPNLY